MIKFMGVLFTLKKRMQMVEEDDFSLYDYLTWGYYDGLSIVNVNSFLEFHPSTVTENKLNINLIQQFVDTYTIRAVIPPDYQKFKEDGFDYSVVESRLKKTKKYISISLINVSRRLVENSATLGDMTVDMIDAIKKSAEQVKIPLKELGCSLYWSIGYSDFIVLFSSNRLDQVLDVITALRGQGEDYAVCSNCYTVCGFKKNMGVEQEKEEAWEKRIKLSLRINMQEGVSGNQLAGELGGMLPESPQKEKAFYNSFGDSDLIFYPEFSIGEYIRLYDSEKMLNPESKVYKEFISSVRTSIHIRNTVPKEPEKKLLDKMKTRDNLEDGLMEKIRSRFAGFCNEYEKFLQYNSFPIRSQRSLQIMLINYLNIIKTSHTFDVCQLLGRIILSTITCMEHYMRADMGIDINEACVKAINISRSKIGGFLADLIRSDRPFIEGHSLTHPSIGSATKLLFSYNVIIQKLSDAMGDMEKNKLESSCFLVMSGGCDFTTAVDIFAFAEPSLGLCKPILIEVPEMSLYDVCGTLFRMSHECMHYCGERFRQERAVCIVTAISNFIAYDLYSFMKKAEEELIKDACIFLKEGEKTEVIANMDKTILEKKTKARERLSVIIKDRLRDRFFEKLPNNDEKLYYLDPLMYEVLSEKKAAEVFLERKDRRDKGEVLQVKIYKELRAYLEEVHDCLSMELKKNRPTFHPLSLNRQEFEFEKIKTDFYNKGLSDFIDRYFKALLGNFTEELEKSIKLVYTYKQLIEMTVNPLKEGFADCMAARALNMPLEDFILSFIYENWNLNCALPITTENYLRIGADLKVLYKIEGRLPDKKKKAIENKMEAINRNFRYEYKVKAADLTNRLNEILGYYSEIKDMGITSVIEEYLAKCIEGIDEGKLEDIRDVYEKCSVKDKQAHIYSMLEVLMNKWRSLCKWKEVTDED